MSARNVGGPRAACTSRAVRSAVDRGVHGRRVYRTRPGLHRRSPESRTCMKAHVAANATTVPTTTAVSERRALDFLTLTKPRLNMLVLITTLGGLYLASPHGVAPMLVVHTLIGTALVAGGAAALNQVWERETDARMRRTARSEERRAGK